MQPYRYKHYITFYDKSQRAISIQGIKSNKNKRLSIKFTASPAFYS